MAREFQVWNVSAWLEEITWFEFLDWYEFFGIELLSSERDDIASGVVASVIANSNRDPKKGREFTFRDFTPVIQWELPSRFSAKAAPIKSRSEWSKLTSTLVKTSTTGRKA